MYINNARDNNGNYNGAVKYNIEISNATDKYPYSWILGIYSEHDHVSIEDSIINPVVKITTKGEQKNNVYIIRKRKYTTINQNY